MAKKTTTKSTAKTTAKTAAKTALNAGELTTAMDYAQHEATWRAFTAMVKWSTIALLVILVALYCFIIVAQPILGLALLLTLPAGAVWLFVNRSGAVS